MEMQLTLVGLTGLDHRPELNGCRAQIVGSLEDRWVVEVFTAPRRRVAVKASNLLMIPNN